MLDIVVVIVGAAALFAPVLLAVLVTIRGLVAGGVVIRFFGARVFVVIAEAGIDEGKHCSEDQCPRQGPPISLSHVQFPPSRERSTVEDARASSPPHARQTRSE